MRKAVGIDLDSTLNCLDNRWIEVYNKEYNDSLEVKDITAWDWSHIVKPECGKKIYDYLRTPGFFYNLGIREGAQEVTKWIAERADIFIITAYIPSSVLDKSNWLSENFPHIDKENIIFANKKGRFIMDAMIDDGGHNIEAYKQWNPDGLALLFDSPCPWNYYLEDKYPRVHNWYEVKKALEAVL